MSLLQMSFQGGALILAAALLRALTLHRLPKGTFLALWAVAAARLLVPVSIPSPWSVYALAPAAGESPAGRLPAETVLPGAAPVPPAPAAPPAETGGGIPVWTLVWLAGVLAWGGFFLVSYLRCCREFRTALPADEAPLRERLAAGGLRRPVALRRSDRIAAPLTYGILRPVILLPKTLDGAGGARMTWILEHELTHIRHFDALFKLVLTAAACVHWFNPLVWGMYLLANRDMELRCDEAVVRRLGVDRRGDYARTLISMEACKSGLGPLTSAFSRNAAEERILAIMRLKKRSLAALLAAAALICGMSAAFATSAAEKDEEDLRDYLTMIPGNDFSEEESQRLFALWIDDYEDMTVATFREKMRSARTDGDMELIERFSQSGAVYQLPAGKNADALAAFNDYFFNVYEPLTADRWQTREFDGFGSGGVEYMYNLTILNADALKVGGYEQVRRDAETILRQPVETMADVLEIEKLSTAALQVELGYYVTSFGPKNDPDALLHAQFSSEAAAEWDRLLSPYVPLGLTYRFEDPDLDGNGLTMWFEGREVRGIWDERENIWLTEHSGTGFSEGAVELYAVYTDGVLTGLRPATAEEQAQWNGMRGSAANARISLGTATLEPETRAFPRATRADYDALLSLKTADYREETLEAFNQRLLDWANANEDAYNRINCDVIWNDCAVELTEEERAFADLTCRHSGMENGMMIRALHTGRAEQDPGFAASLPERAVTRDGSVMAWCDLYYDVTYHVSDKSAVTVGERDACVGGMLSAISAFWQETDMEALLAMTEEDVAARFSAWAAAYSTAGVTFAPVTADSIHFEHMDERGIYDGDRGGEA